MQEIYNILWYYRFLAILLFTAI